MIYISGLFYDVFDCLTIAATTLYEHYQTLHESIFKTCIPNNRTLYCNLCLQHSVLCRMRHITVIDKRDPNFQAPPASQPTSSARSITSQFIPLYIQTNQSAQSTQSRLLNWSLSKCRVPHPHAKSCCPSTSQMACSRRSRKAFARWKRRLISWDSWPTVTLPLWCMRSGRRRLVRRSKSSVLTVSKSTVQ